MMGVDVVITGNLADKAFDQLQASVSTELTLSMDSGGNVAYTQNAVGPLSENATQLVNAIDNSSIVVNVDATSNKTTQSGSLFIGGAFSGNTVTPGLGPVDVGNSVSALQEVNPNVLGAMSDAHGMPGADMLHEVTEAYQGALISQETGVSSPASNQAGSVYNQAHNAATPQSGGVFEKIYDASGNQMKMLPGNTYPTGVQRVEWYVNGQNNNQIIIQTLP